MPNKRRVKTLIGVKLDSKADEVTLAFRQTNGEQFNLVMPPAMVSGLFGTLAGVSQKISSMEQGGVTAQPMTVTSARHAVGPARQPILDLTLEGSGHIVLTIPREGLEPLRTALAELFELSKPVSQAH